jgi:acetylornithine deacetylase/succinyl-diaminopimelate desuccinylase-like protein
MSSENVEIVERWYAAYNGRDLEGALALMHPEVDATSAGMSGVEGESFRAEVSGVGDLEATGRAAHSAYPADGKSAIDALLDTIERIRKLPLPSDPLLGQSTLNIGLIGGGVAPNVIPPSASAQIHFRIVEPVEPLKAAIQGQLAPGVTVSFPVEMPLFKGGVAPAGWETTVVSYASDLPFLAVLAHDGKRFVLRERPLVDAPHPFDRLIDEERGAIFQADLDRHHASST